MDKVTILTNIDDRADDSLYTFKQPPEKLMYILYTL